MSDYATEIEAALAGALRASERLTSAKTVETSIRECLFAGEKYSAGFRDEELPAIGISAQIKPATSGQFTPSEEELRIPVAITVVSRGRKGKVALETTAELVDGVKYEVRQLRRSGNVLGTNAWVFGDIASSVMTADEQSFTYAIATVEFTVSKVVEL